MDYTCDGADKSPQLTFSAAPPGTQTLAIVADDPDAPGGIFTHWIGFNVRADVPVLPEGADLTAFGGAVGTNDFSQQRYSGPCPPKGEIHHYYFRVYALNAPLGIAPGSSRSAIDGAMSGHVLAEGALMGVFSH